jgi:hypothetical protein
MNKMSVEELAYLAGIIDGEGTISITINRHQTENSYAHVMRVYTKKDREWKKKIHLKLKELNHRGLSL